MMKKFLFVIFCAVSLLLSAQPVPKTISNLKAWYRSDSLVSLSGSLVSQWGDASGNGLNAIQGITANRPSLVSSVPGINGKPVVKFDGVNDFLQVASFAQGQPLSVFYSMAHHRFGRSVCIWRHNCCEQAVIIPQWR